MSAADTAALVDLASAIARFGTELVPLLAEADGNVAYSPLGIHAALAMLAAGAASESRAAFETLLGTPVDADFSARYRELLASVQSSAGTEIATRFDYSSKLTPSEAWRDTLVRDFDAAMEAQDFAKDPRGATARLDAWIRDKTHGRIPSLFSPSVLPRHTSFVAVSTLAFRHTWAARFSLFETESRPFVLATGKCVDVPMMHAKNLKVRVGRTRSNPTAHTATPVGIGMNGPLWVTIPFETGDTVLLLGLPATTADLPALERELTTIGVAAILERLREGSPEVWLPKIDWLTPTFSVNDALEKLPPGHALQGLELSGGEALSDLTVLQRVAIRWDEQGADMAAATAAAATGIGLVTAKPLAFDHPFVFVVVQPATGLILFQGRVLDPRG